MFLFQAALHSDHGDLNNVRRRALDGHVARNAFAERPQVVVGAGQLRQIAPAAEHGFRVALFFGFLHHALHVFMNAGIVGEIIVDILLSLPHGNVNVVGKRKRADTVYNAEIDRLGTAAHQGGDQLLRHVEHLRRRAAVDVVAVSERLNHVFVVGNVGKDAQLNL